MKRIATLVTMLAIVGMIALPASAYTLNADGTGFVGKGEVQTAFGWNNKALQDDAAAVAFEVSSTTVTETTWTCTNTNNDNVQERSRRTTTTTQGLVSSVARERNQITGFNLTGFSGSPTESTSSEGNQLFSCPTNWDLADQEVGDAEVIAGGVYATFGSQRVLLP